ncbi:hypothetical protein Rhal01_03140 [Rubritalea halochordaticola]|uniref:DUF4469 domain-containing protein n=1 Tax=Rubritalea halochordaticola TaxID=714537 RepID=A0ABP9V6G3_9BACT
MKRLFVLMLLLGVGLSSSVVVAQQEEDTGKVKPRVLRVQMEFIEVSQATMLDLMYGEGEAISDSDLRGKMQALLKEEKASMLDSQVIVCRNGEKCTSESISEFQYPTKYEAVELPNHVEANIEEVKEVLENLVVAPTPSSFETRNLGTTIELECNVDKEGKEVAMRLAPEIVWHVGDVIWAEWSDKKTKLDIKMPKMYTLRVNTGITVPMGKYGLVSVMNPKDENGFPDNQRKVLCFVKVNEVLKGK